MRVWKKFAECNAELPPAFLNVAFSADAAGLTPVDTPALSPFLKLPPWIIKVNDLREEDSMILIEMDVQQCDRRDVILDISDGVLRVSKLRDAPDMVLEILCEGSPSAAKWTRYGLK